MRLASRAALWLLLTVGLCSCTRTVEVKAETHETALLVEKQLSKEKVVETVQRGPSETVIYKFAPPEENKPVSGNAGPPVVVEAEARTPNRHWPVMTTSVRPISDPRSNPPVSDGLPPHGPLVEMDVIHTGPSIATKATEATASSSATQAIKLDSKTETTTKTRYGPPLWLLALLAAALALVVWLAFKFSLFGRIAAFLK